MKRKEFIKTSTAMLAGSALTSYLACSSEANPKVETEHTPSVVERKNWAGNYSYRAAQLHEPQSVKEVQELVKKLDQQKALGSTHCFNNIADSPKNQISTKKLNKLVKLDKENKILTVEAGARYGEFSKELHEEGFALHNLASLPHITVAGACATATHGSGVKNGNLATAVRLLSW